MHDTLTDLIARRRALQFATAAGTRMHARLHKIVIDGDNTTGDAELIAHIKECDGLAEYFANGARTEVPVAGVVAGKFISRRIDRMRIDTAARKILVLDYKTDVDTNARRDTYVAQVREYCALLRRIYPDFAISAAILWTHEWRLEKL